MLARLGLTSIIGISVVVAAVAQVPPDKSSRVAEVAILDNGTVSITRLRLAAGARELPHSHAHPTLLVLLSRGDLEMHNGTSQTKATRHAGDVEFVNKGARHLTANIGSTPVEALVLTIKSDRKRGGALPTTLATPGVTRTVLIDNADVTVFRTEYEADIRESLHTHAYDLLILPTIPSRIDLQLGDKKEIRSVSAGKTVFIHRSLPHAIANIGPGAFRAIAIAFK